MRTAEDWASETGVPVWAVRQIQADAIRWATNLTGDLHRLICLEKADELDPPKPHPKP